MMSQQSIMKKYKVYEYLTCADDGSLGVAPETVLENPGELAVSVGDVAGLSAAQLLDHLENNT